MHFFITVVRWVHQQLGQWFGKPSQLPVTPVKHRDLEKLKPPPQKTPNCCLTNVVEPDPVRGIHFFLDVPRYDEVLAMVERVLQRGRRQRGPALGGHQVGVAVGPGQSDGTADHGDGVTGGGAAPLRQRPQVLRAQGVTQVGAASSWGRQVIAGSHRQVGGIVGTGPGWQHGGGEGGTHAGRLVDPQRSAEGRRPLVDSDGKEGQIYAFDPADFISVPAFDH